MVIRYDLQVEEIMGVGEVAEIWNEYKEQGLIPSQEEVTKKMTAKHNVLA